MNGYIWGEEVWNQIILIDPLKSDDKVSQNFITFCLFSYRLKPMETSVAFSLALKPTKTFCVFYLLKINSPKEKNNQQFKKIAFNVFQAIKSKGHQDSPNN